MKINKEGDTYEEGAKDDGDDRQHPDLFPFESDECCSSPLISSKYCEAVDLNTSG